MSAYPRIRHKFWLGPILLGVLFGQPSMGQVATSVEKAPETQAEASSTTQAGSLKTSTGGLPAAPFSLGGLDALSNEIKLVTPFGETKKISDFAGPEGLAILFVGADCPLAQLYLDRFGTMAVQADYQGLGFLLVDANIQDSLEDLKRVLDRQQPQVPLVKDLDAALAERLGATRTPEAFLIDAQGQVVYRGRVDDQYLVGQLRDKATKREFVDAVKSLLADKPIDVMNTTAVGCIIGRKRKPRTEKSLPGEITYAEHIAPLLAKHCVECHRAGDIGPMELVDYDEVSGWAETIVEVIDDRRMPPWHSTDPVGTFKNERGMSDEERQLVRQWVETGAASGDLSKVAPPTNLTTEWRLESEPDEIHVMRETPFSVPSQGTVDYQYFVVDPGWKEDRWIKAAQVLPGDRAVVHHSILYLRKVTPRSNGSSSQDAFEQLGTLGGYVPGQEPMVLEKGQARLVPAGSKLIFQMHYTPKGRPAKDQTRIGVWFANDAEVTERVESAVLINKDFEIAPHDPDARVRTSLSGFPSGTKLLALTPHMHVRGKSVRVWQQSKTDNGADEYAAANQLLEVPYYDFNWQHSYTLTQPLVLEPDTQISFECVFDNSAKNRLNPDPNVAVRWGDQTWQEMALVFLTVAVPRDAQLRLEQASSTSGESSAKRARSFLDRLDVNKDGYIDRSEAPETFVTFAFARFDRDGDDRISLAELQQGKE